MGEAADKLKVDWRGNATVTKAPAQLRLHRKPMRFVSLHHHSTFSYQDGYQLPAAHVRRATELRMGALALTEHGNVSSHSKLEQAAQKEGVHPIFGCEIYTGPVGEGKGTQRKYHLTVLAENAEGYRNLLRMVSQSYKDFYYEPTVSWENLKRHRQGLVILSGCTGSLLACSLVGGKLIDPQHASYDLGRAVAQKFKRVFGAAYYLEVQAFPELENVVRLNKMLAQLGEELQIPLVASCDIHYTTPDESEMQQILHNIRGGNKQTLEEQARAWSYDVPLSPPLTDRLVLRRMEAAGLTHRQAVEAVLNTELIGQRCDVTLPTLPRLRYPVAPGETAQGVWRTWLSEGWRYRRCHLLPPAERDRYKRQLAYEMDIMERKDFTDYFLIVSDIVKFAKDHDVAVGPARGSAAASLVCWLLRITEVNPMLFPSLVFERFIDMTREDLPDIDLDFDSEKRWMIDDYATAKYGLGNVGKIGTFTYFKSKNSLDDIGHVYRIPKFEIDTVKELLLERSSGDLRASATIEDTFDQFEAAAAVAERHPEIRKAMDLEGNVKGMGVHAAGLVIANGPITDVCALYEREVKKQWVQVISLDKYDCERQGLVKIDILGLTTMTMISKALDMLHMKVTDLYDIPLDDPAVIKGFHDNDVVAIFQFDGRAMRSVNAELQPDSFKEICDVNALARPGPLHNNASAAYIDIKKGRKKPEKLHPIYDEIASQTNYQIVYQEQILRIVREIGDFDWTAAAYIRKIISKKLGEQEFNRQWERFREGALRKGLEEETARKIWGLCITSGSYAFNAAHCVSYGMLAYWCMWLKVHHPVEFYVASLGAYDPEKHQLNLLRDAMKHGIEALPLDPNYSQSQWTAAEGRLIGGFEQVSGIGDKTGPKIIEWRNAQQRKVTFEDFQAIGGIGPKTVDKMVDFAEREDPYGIHKLHRRLESVKRELPRLRLPSPTHTSLQVPYSRGTDQEVTWIGMLRHRNLRDLFESNFARTGVQLDPADVKNPELREWVIGVGYDEDELVTITWDRWRYPRFKKAIWGIALDDDVVLIRGVKKGFQARRAIYVTDMWVIGE